jgi:hypothetical protein
MISTVPVLTRHLGLLLVLSTAAATWVRSEESFALKDLDESIQQAFNEEKPDLSEMAYVCMRGAAFYSTAAIIFRESAPKDEQGNKIITNLESLSAKYLRVGVALSGATGKSAEAIKEQASLLGTIYAKEMIRTKQLNNEYFGPRIKKDQEALKKIEGAVLALADQIAENSKTSKK